MADQTPQLDSRVQQLEKNDAVQDVEIASLKQALNALTEATKEVVVEVKDLKNKGLWVLVLLLGGEKVGQITGLL